MRHAPSVFRLGVALTAIAAASLVFLSFASDPPTLTFEDRVAAQEAIEQVYYSHLVGATKRFEEAVPRTVLEKKVHLYLQESAALEILWETPVTAAMLRQEAERIAASTRMPERLRELFDALGNDTLLIQECLVRPVLVDRMVRQRRSAMGRSGPKWDGWWSQVLGGVDEGIVQTVATAEESLTRIRALMAEASGSGAITDSCPVGDSWDNGSLDHPGPGSGTTAVWTGTHLISWGGRSGSSYLDSGERYDPVTDSVAPTSTIDAPSARAHHVAVWTGDRMIVWSGLGDQGTVATGGTYDPVLDTWSATSTLNAPSHRYDATAVWTGGRMIVWGGVLDSVANYTPLNSGGLYDPLSDSWSATSLAGAPSARVTHTAVWTGARMIVWGGRDPMTFSFNTGGLYDPVSNTWAPTSLVNAPDGREQHAAVWTGREMIVWGQGGGPNGRYNPQTNSWTAVSTIGAPEPQNLPLAVWTGTTMIVWGGPTATAPAGRYDPATNTWLPVSPDGAPPSNAANAAVWTGVHMIVWGTVPGRYEPNDDHWVPTLVSHPPRARRRNTAVWTGSEMIVWGGLDGGALDSGGRYDPALDAWRPVSALGAPPPRDHHTAVWTGSEMIVWGGGTATFGRNTGGRYDPMLDVWRPTSTANAPTARTRHTAVWTGSRMIVWGGKGVAAFENTGGLYDPVADAWSPATVAGAPVGRAGHLAVWTGGEMIVWGGQESTQVLTSGGRYDPGSGSWLSTSTAVAPSGGLGATAVWSGAEMIVWGGSAVNTGARYSPLLDRWEAVSQLNAPFPRAMHTAVWADGEMILWGGRDLVTNEYLDSGGRYDPSADSWKTTSTIAAPSPRGEHSAVWTGGEMIVWGGGFDTGGRYVKAAPSDVDQDGDGYTLCAGDCDDARPEVHPGALETCDERDDDCDGMIPANEADADEDGFAVCDGDCDDTTPGVHPGGLDVCDGIDNDCDGSVDDADHDGQDCSVDCDDSDPAVHIGAPEACDGKDTNCDGSLESYEHDADGDGWMAGQLWDPPGPCPWRCVDPFERYCTRDCDDTDPSVYAGAPEVCGDGLVNDCVTRLARGLPYGSCTSPSEYWNEEDCDGDGVTECQGDCAPTDASTHPGVQETCDGRDNDCDGAVDENLGSTSCGIGTCLRVVPNCSGGVPQTCTPGAPSTEVCDGLDNDCNGSVDEVDADQDGASACLGDCDDTNASIHPGAVDVPGDPWDQDCVGGATCDPAGTWTGHGDYISCVDNECTRLKKAGFLTGKECDAIVKAAATNQWGGP